MMREDCMADDESHFKSIRVGISSCLLGAMVRFDGQHKRDRYITDILGDYFEFIPVCPELEVGMGVPRESVRLAGDPHAPRMVGNKTGADWTARMNRYARARVGKRDLNGICGYILKKDSPSCGMDRVKVYGDNGYAKRVGTGLFAAALKDKFPFLPIEEEGRLHDLPLRENFIERVFAYYHVRHLFRKNYTRGAVVDFHARNKYLILSHSTTHYTRLGKLVAAIARYEPYDFKHRYSELFMEAMAKPTTIKKNVNVLQHIMGYLKRSLDSEEKSYINGVIDDYRNSLVPLIVPLTLIKHYILKYNVEYIAGQVYLNPHPKELMLRNHV